MNAELHDTATPELLTIKEMAKVLAVGKNTAYELIHAQTIPVIWIGKRMRVSRRALLEWIEKESR